MHRPLRRARLLAVALVAALGVAAPPAPAADPPVRVWPLGDSITYGTIWRPGPAVPRPPAPVWRNVPVYDPADPSRFVSPGGYRAPLHLLLSQAGVAHEYVGAITGNAGPVLTRNGQTRHDGHPGWHVSEVSALLDAVALAPDLVVLHIGTNDISQGVDPIAGYPNGGAPLTTPAQRERFAENLGTRLQALVDKVQARNPGARIVLSTILPIAMLPTDDEGRAVTSYLYNEQVKAVARAEAGQGVVLADVWSLFAAYVPATAATPDAMVLVRPGTMSPDGHHPLPPTYEAMAAAYRAAVLEALGR